MYFYLYGMNDYEDEGYKDIIKCQVLYQISKNKFYLSFLQLTYWINDLKVISNLYHTFYCKCLYFDFKYIPIHKHKVIFFLLSLIIIYKQQKFKLPINYIIK